MREQLARDHDESTKRLRHHERDDAGRQAMRQRRGRQASAGVRQGSRVGKTGVVEKAQIARRRAVECRNIADGARGGGRRQIGTGQGGDLSQRETPRVSLEYRLAHAASSVPPTAVKIRTSCRR